MSAAGCGGAGSSTADNSPAEINSDLIRPVGQSDMQIAQSLYRDNQRTPPGFYSDSKPSGIDYVATAHLKNTDLDGSTAAAQSPHELCTDDWLQAFNWSEAAAKKTPAYSDLAATNDDTRFFEFDRVRPGNPALYTRTRVFKCSYLDRSSANLRVASGVAGRLNQRPLDAVELRRLSEYLWQFTGYNNYGHAVLKSSGGGAESGLSHVLIIANLVSKGLSAQCDRVDIVSWRYSVDLARGELQVDTQQLWSFGARDDSGFTQLCGS